MHSPKEQIYKFSTGAVKPRIRGSKLAVTITVDDVVNTSIRLGLTTAVVGISGGVAVGEQRASEKRAGILSVYIVVS